MGKKRVVALIFVFLAAAVTISCAEEVKTIKGEVVDISCYVPAGAKGEDHKTCAIACLKAGEPAGIVEEGTGRIYVVVTGDHSTNPADKIMPFVAKMVEVTGSVNERSGLSVIDIKSIKEISSSSMDMPEKNKSMMDY